MECKDCTEWNEYAGSDPRVGFCDRLTEKIKPNVELEEVASEREESFRYDTPFDFGCNIV